MSSVPNNTPPGQLPITQEKLQEVIAKSMLSTTSNGCYGQICTLKVSNASSGTIRALTRTEAFFTFNPLGRGLKGAWSIVPGTIDLVKEGALAVNDGVGATVYSGLNAATGSNIPYESSGALGQSIQQEGVLATSGKLVHGVVTNLPGIGLINGLYHRNPEMIGSGVVGALPLGAPLMRRGSAATAGESAPRLPSGPASSPRSPLSQTPPSTQTPKKPAGLAIEKADKKPKTPFEEMYEKAPAAKAEIDKLAHKIADENGGKVAEAPVKSAERALEKIETDYGGDPTKIKDLARNTIVVADENIGAVTGRLEAEGANVKIIDSTSDPLGYSGANTTIKTQSGITGEIQVNSPEMIFAKEPPNIARSILGDDVYNSISERSGVPGGRGHELYAQWRSLDPNSAQAQTIAAESRAYYDSIRRNARGNN
jgi:hypothetical protein